MITTNGAIFALQFRKRGKAAFSSIDIVSQCLSDIPRTNAFQKAITEKVRAGSTVLDSGTGSGILALFAARAGAKKVISLEYDPFIADAARKVIEANGAKNIEVRIGDGRRYDFEPGLLFDAVIMEMLTTGMIDECQVSAVNNLHKRGAVDKNTVFIPSRQDTFVALGNFDFTCYGLKVPFIRHTWRFYDPAMRSFTALSKKALVHTVEFGKPSLESCEAVLNIDIVEGGVINSIHLTSVTMLTQTISLGDTDSLNGPVVMPLPETTVNAGQRVQLSIRYVFGGGFESIRVSIKQ